MAKLRPNKTDASILCQSEDFIFMPLLSSCNKRKIEATSARAGRPMLPYCDGSLLKQEIEEEKALAASVRYITSVRRAKN